MGGSPRRLLGRSLRAEPDRGRLPSTGPLQRRDSPSCRTSWCSHTSTASRAGCPGWLTACWRGHRRTPCWSALTRRRPSWASTRTSPSEGRNRCGGSTPTGLVRSSKLANDWNFLRQRPAGATTRASREAPSISIHDACRVHAAGRHRASVRSTAWKLTSNYPGREELPPAPRSPQAPPEHRGSTLGQDDEPGTATFGAIERSSGAIVGVATVFRDPAPFNADRVEVPPGAGSEHRLAPPRMATRADPQGQGIGVNGAQRRPRPCGRREAVTCCGATPV